MVDVSAQTTCWVLDVQCPLTPYPVRVQIDAEFTSGWSETRIGWSPVEDIFVMDDGRVQLLAALGGVHGVLKLDVVGEWVRGEFSMQQPFVGTFDVTGRVAPQLLELTTVAEAVDTRAPYLPVLREAAGLAGFTVYRPVLDEPRPVVIWGNGGGSLSNEGALAFLTQIAAAGFVVLAPGVPSARATAVGNDARPEVLDAAIEWAASGAAPYITSDAIAVMGHSMGGVQAWAAAKHPSVSSLASWNGSSAPGGHDKKIVEAITVPVMIVTGGERDGAHPSSVRDFEALRDGASAVLIENELAGHGGIFRGANDRDVVLAGGEPIDGELAVVASVLAIRWLNLTLLGDRESGGYLLGASPRIVGLRGWRVLAQTAFTDN